MFPVLKVLGLNPNGITWDRRSQSIFEKSFDYRESQSFRGMDFQLIGLRIEVAIEPLVELKKLPT